MEGKVKKWNKTKWEGSKNLLSDNLWRNWSMVLRESSWMRVALRCLGYKRISKHNIAAAAKFTLYEPHQCGRATHHITCLSQLRCAMCRSCLLVFFLSERRFILRITRISIIHYVYRYTRSMCSSLSQRDVETAHSYGYTSIYVVL